VSDQKAREQAARDYARSAVIVAGAGTGKTTLLVERLLCQMVETELELDAFAAITFSEKAAAELRVRLGEELAELARLARTRAPAEASDAKRAAGRAYRWLLPRVGQERIERIARARLGGLAGAQVVTIHAFCAGLLRGHPLECGVDPSFAVDTGLGFEALKDELWSAHLAGDHGPDGARSALWRRVLAGLESGELELLGRALASFAPTAQAAEHGLAGARERLASLARAALARIAACRTTGASKGPESWLAAARAPLEALRDSGTDAFRAALAAARFTDGRNRPKGLLDGSAPSSKQSPAAEELADELHALFRKLRAVENELLADALELVRPYTDAVRAEARRRGILPFDALLALARDLLRDDVGVRRELGARYRMLFVDELQDTDPVQYEIVFFLAEAPDLAPATDAFATRLVPGKLFIVGDPKQAIYRFRGADLAAYHAAVRHVVETNGGARLVLSANWRARPETLEPLGALLQPLLEAPDADSANAYSGYEPLVSGREPAGEPRVERWRVGDANDPQNADGSRRGEAEAIAGFIADQVASARAQPGDFALLFRSLRDVRVYTAALRERGIECWIGRSDEPEREPASQQLLALLRALANPADAPAVLGVLRSPFGAVPDAELARFAARYEGGARLLAWSYPEVFPPADSFPNLARTFAALRGLYARARALAPAHLLASLLEDTPLFALHAGARDGQRRVRDLEVLLEWLADAARATPGCDLGHVVRALEAEDTRATLDDDARRDRVRLLTIHGAKGLEFATVLLPDLARPKGSPDRNVEAEVVRAQGALALRTRAGTSASWIDFEHELALHERAELGRLFYVACTRARERLIFVDSHRARAAPPSALVGFLDTFPATLDVPHPLPARLAARPAPEDSGADALERARAAVAHAAANTRPPFLSPSGVREEADARDEASERPGERAPAPVNDSPALRNARALGSLVHDALERWDFRDTDSLWRLAHEATVRAARRESLDPHALDREGDELFDALLESELPAHLASVQVIGRELPLLFHEADGSAWSGTLDLLYRDGDGRLVVADYKTDRAPDEAARARYHAQLATYARGVAHVFPNEPAPLLELIWLRSGKRERFRLESPP